MFDRLFKKPAIISRHKNAPHKEERERYLRHRMQQGYSISSLSRIAQELLWVAREMPFPLERGMTHKKVEVAAMKWADHERYQRQTQNIEWTRMKFIRIARLWFRFLGCWREPDRTVPFAHLIDAFRLWMKDERGFTSQTIQIRCVYLGYFLKWYNDRHCDISAVCLKDIDCFLAYYGAKCTSRASVKTLAAALRTFFKYAGTQGWCSPSIAPGIHGPRVYTQERLPMGPSWPDVRRLISSMETDRSKDIRDKAIVMLLAIYGFRAMEVLTLRLEDIDWEQNLILVSRAKRRVRQSYPLIPAVGNAIIRYLQEVRRLSSHREIFLTLVPPFRPLAGGTLASLTGRRMTHSEIRAPHLGPHSLRHACASHLVAEGFSLKEIGDHLGHHCSSSTRIYAKVNLPGLREVATFDAGGLI